MELGQGASRVVAFRLEVVLDLGLGLRYAPASSSVQLDTCHVVGFVLEACDLMRSRIARPSDGWDLQGFCALERRAPAFAGARPALSKTSHDDSPISLDPR
jgi:hypothetical protein